MQNNIQAVKQSALQDICLVSGDELAKAVGFKSAAGGFRSWCQQSGTEPVPGRRSQYDPKLVRMRLDELQGMALPAAEMPSLSLVEQRRARRDTR